MCDTATLSRIYHQRQASKERGMLQMGDYFNLPYLTLNYLTLAYVKEHSINTLAYQSKSLIKCLM